MTRQKIHSTLLTKSTTLLLSIAVIAALFAVPTVGGSQTEEIFAPVHKRLLIRRDPVFSGRGTVVSLGETVGVKAKVGDVVSFDQLVCDAVPITFSVAGGVPAAPHCLVASAFVYGKVTTTDRVTSFTGETQPTSKMVSLRGRVVDGLTGSPIRTAVVTIKDSANQVVAGPLSVDGSGFFTATVLGSKTVNLTVSAAATGFLSVTGSPFPSLGPSSPVLNDVNFLTNGGLDIALVNGSKIPTDGLVTTLLWMRSGVRPNFFLSGAWESVAANQQPGQGVATPLPSAVTSRTRVVEQLPGGPFHEVMTNRTNVTGTIRFVVDIFWFSGDATYATSNVQAFFFTPNGLQLAVRGPFDESSLIQSPSHPYPFWHVAEYKRGTDTVAAVLPVALRSDSSAAAIITADLMSLAPDFG